MFPQLRHSFGTWMFAAGSKPRNIQYMMGHKNIATTLGYAHATDKGNQADINNIQRIHLFQLTSIFMTDFCYVKHVCYNQYVQIPWECGGIGRRAGLKMKYVN